ncbi:PREDICTED: uncharacterized protein LOC109330963 [Lupinus angustifolius]|nr:PREDICTED: uncharacterized protein LOC109330963 [Lupinus angustifolius]
MKSLFQKHVSHKLHLFIILCSTISMIFEYVCGVNLPNNETVPAVIIFGDSIVDSGNNNYIDTLIKCNFPPYGRDFGEGNHPTGRFSNGLVPSDIIAAKFGVKEILPAYLDPDLQIQELLTGVSFASGGAGYDPLTSELVSVMSLSDQLNMFKEYIGKLNDAIGGKRTTTIISKSIYIVCIGSDDIANTYSQTPFRRGYDIQSYTDLMASEASNFLQKLYGLGARKIGVFNVPVIGCVPSQRTIGGGIMRACSDFSNQVAILFNSKLSFQMESLQTKLFDAKFVYLDSYNPLLDILQNPSKYGFEEADRGCCGTGNIEVGILCNPYSINTCSNSSNYIFWDSYHPTEKTYHVLSSLVLDHKIKDFSNHMMNLSNLKSLYVCPLLVMFFNPYVVTSISNVKSSFLDAIAINFTFPSVIAFGDSILDTGNNNYLETIVKSNFKPYGRDFFGGKPTGRFCNGRVPSDFFAEILGVKESLPPYLDPDLQIEDLLTGVCFASAGSGYDPLTIERTTVLSIDDQLTMFKEYIAKLNGAVGEERTSMVLAKSIIVISMGSNDISGSYFQSPYRRCVFDIDQYTSILINQNSKFVQELYELGARKIGVLSLGPVGCVPMQRTIGGGTQRKCVVEINDACLLYNSKLYSSIMALNATYQDARIVYLDTYTGLNAFVQYPNLFGFENGNGSCCGIANVELGPLCNSFVLKMCEDASKYVFWDSYHPTDRAYNLLTSDAIKKTIHQFI